ncbi:hypothetical protein F511_21924 [Dorcoceras hygrometricum]|uniref:Uncharacterized protein n=1 Tax=Dorcoceras hygrometricum TaxID=472368 RepID=A0A2Z7AYQ6_9LAMI|nr:hypothetical protein F511_21924 [Dorcoceras hygrometricum]
MEQTGMAWMFKTLENTGLKRFLAASSSVYESVVVEFFANVKVITGTIVSFVAKRKLALTKETFAKAFGLPTEGMTRFLDIPSHTVVEMRGSYPTDKGKGVLPYLDRPNPVEEHYLLVIQDIRDKVECQIQVYDQWHRLVELHMREVVSEPWKEFHKEKSSANQDLMEIRLVRPDALNTD